MIELINLIISSLPGLILLVVLVRLPLRKNISYSIQNGTTCYRCKEDIPLEDPNNWMISGNGKRQLCKVCERDVKLSSLTGKRKIYFTWNSESSAKIQISLGILAMIFLLIGIVIKPLNILGSIFVLASSTYFLMNHLSTTKRKKLNGYARIYNKKQDGK